MLDASAVGEHLNAVLAALEGLSPDKTALRVHADPISTESAQPSAEAVSGTESASIARRRPLIHLRWETPDGPAAGRGSPVRPGHSGSQRLFKSQQYRGIQLA